MTNQRLLDATAEAFPNHRKPTTPTKRRRPKTPNPHKGRAKQISREEVHTRTLKGQSVHQIAQALGYSARGISNVRAELGITHPRMITPEKLATIAQALQDGWSHAEIARTHNTTHETIERHFPGTAWTPEQRNDYARTIRKEHGYNWSRQRQETSGR